MTSQEWRIDEAHIERGLVIGQGRTGIVYRVRYRGAVMALKVLIVGANQQRMQVERFLLKEAKALQQLRHPNVIR